MKSQPYLTVVAGFMILALIFKSTIAPVTAIPSESSVAETEVAQAIGLDLTDDQRRATTLVQTLPVEEVLGSLAPIALSPFFALTCLSGASLLSEAGLLPEGVANNFIMGRDSPLSHGPVFIGLLALTLLTAAPKLTKVSKPFAQAVDQIEGYSGIIAAIAVQVLSRVTMESDAPSEQIAMVYQAGFITATYSTIMSALLIAFSAINIFVVNSVKFFFEVMILISPFPTVDAIFEAANKAFTALLIAVYLISPWLAMVLNLLIFAFSLAVFMWTYRRADFMRCALSDPFFGWFAETFFRMRPMTEKSTKLPKSIDEAYLDGDVILKAFVGKKMKGFSRKSKGFLVHKEGKTYFIKPRLFREDKVAELGGEDLYSEVREGLFSHSIAFAAGSGETIQKILITKRYNNALHGIQRGLNSKSNTEGAGDFSSLGKSLKESLQGSKGDDLRSEFA
ncbi:MAG: hypothetical protein MI748_03020 [Opitutales bacterium]|nr:hypothetical protein [Opitutales bacterium]